MDSSIDPRALLTTPNLVDVGMAGDSVRRQMHGARTTFLRVFEVHVDGLPSTFPQGLAAGEIRIVGNPASEDAAVHAVAAAGALANGVPLSGFALHDLMALAGDAAALRALCKRLRTAGLDSVAELAIDVDLPIDRRDAVLAARDGGLRVERVVVSQQPGGERRNSPIVDAGSSMDVEGRLATVNAAADLQDRVGDLRVFAPLARTTSAAGPTTGYADIKQIAVARTVVRNIDSIQVDWSLYGPKLAQVALTAGADDVDGVAAFDVSNLGPRRSALEEIRNNIRAAGLQPVERDGRFNPVDAASHVQLNS